MRSSDPGLNDRGVPQPLAHPQQQLLGNLLGRHGATGTLGDERRRDLQRTADEMSRGRQVSHGAPSSFKMSVSTLNQSGSVSISKPSMSNRTAAGSLEAPGTCGRQAHALKYFASG